MKFIVEFIKKNILDEGMLLLKDYPNDVIIELLNENIDAIFLVDEKKGIDIRKSNIIQANKTKMAEYRNLENDKFIVFITDEIIDTFNDINCIEKSDLEEKFDEVFNIEKELKDFVKLLEEDIFVLEKYIYKVLKDVENGYTLYQAIGQNLDILGIFKCEECFKGLNAKQKLKTFNEIKSAFEKRKKNKIISNDELLKKYIELSINNENLKEFILASFEEIIKNKKFTNLDYLKDEVYKLFIEDKKEVKKLGELTIEEIEKDDIELDEEDREFLIVYDKMKNKKSQEERIKEIYNKYRLSIEKNPKLLKDYEKIIYKNKIEGDNFLDILLQAIEGFNLLDIDFIEIKLNNKQKAAILKNYSYFALSYFQKRYLFINKLSKKIKLTWQYLDEDDLKKSDKNFNKAKNSLKFNVIAYKDNEVKDKKVLIYNFNARSMLSSLYDDINTITKKSLFSTQIESKELDIFNISTIITSTKNSYTFFPLTKSYFDLKEIKKEVKICCEELIIYLDKFENSYLKVLQSLENLDFKDVESLKDDYLQIIAYLEKYQNDDEIREKVIEKFIFLGVIFEKNLNNIIFPFFQPLNLLSEIYKMRYVFRLVDESFSSQLEKKDMFFEELRTILKSTFIETIKYKNILTLKENLEGFLLFDDSYFKTIFNKEYQKILLKVIDSYKELYPYKDKIKILLYNFRDKKFILDFTESLEGNFEVDIYDSFKYLKDIYQEFLIYKKIEDEFLALKEINILTNLDKNKKFDIVFFNDYITNFANIEFLDGSKNILDIDEYSPLIFSKKKHLNKNDYKIGTFLLPPLKNQFYKTFELMFKNEKLPAFLVNRKNENLIDTFKNIHLLSNWVVNIDSIIDKSLLKEIDANVIKYKKDRKSNKNIIISSKANLKLLIDRIKTKMVELGVLLKEEEIKYIINEVNEISGDLLLKALNRGSFINELIGTYLVKKIIQKDDMVFIYADDYKEWFEASSDFFNEKNFLTDLIVLKPIFESEVVKELEIYLIESKFISKSNEKMLIDKSLRQTKSAYKLFKNYLSKNRLDSDIFIQKLANLIVEVKENNFSNNLTTSEVREQIIFNQIEFKISAKSFVFVYDSEDEFRNEFLYKFSKNQIYNFLHDNEKIELDLENITIKKETQKKEIPIEEKPEIKQDFEPLKEDIKEVFRYHDLQAVIKEIKLTPNSIIVSLKPNLGWKAQNIESKVKDDFLTVKGLELLRVEAVKGSMNLVFKRDKREIVYYKDIKQREVSKEGYGNTKILIGIDEKNGELVYYDLNSEDPHALIGGMTKSGKSVLLSEMIVDLIRTNSIDDIEFILIDPKKVEFTLFEDSKYVKEVITEKERAIEVLQNLVDEMEKRYEKIREYKLKDINKLYEKTKIKFKRIVVVFDEVADWMVDKDFKKAVEDALSRLSSKARAAGIHLIIATQRPDNSVISPILRANLGAKFALKVDSDKNSNIILGESGAENLLGYGHILAKFNGEKYYIQGCYLDEQEIIEFLS